MKNKLFASAATLAIVFALQSNSALAGPAPALTNLQIIGVSTDVMQPNWINVGFNQFSVSTPLTGTYGFTASYIEGTPSPSSDDFYALITYNNGRNITNETWEAHPTDYVLDSGNYVIGYIYYRGFELARVSSGNLTMEAHDYYNYSRVFYDSLGLTFSPTVAKTASVVELKPTIPQAQRESIQQSVIRQLESKYNTKLTVTSELPQS